MSNCYSIFENDQVLTAEQLNRNFEYIDNQARISRTKMIGVGLICGYEATFKDNIITVEKGAASTSNGDLFYHDSKIKFTKYKTFKDKNAEYPFFTYTSTVGGASTNKQIPLIELFTENDTTVDTKQLSTLTDVNKMVLILYLESFVTDLDECTGSDCDNKGKKQCNNLKAVLVLEEDLKRLRPDRPTPKQFYSQLSDIDITRVVLGPKLINKYRDLHVAYIHTIKETNKTLIPTLKNSYAICRSLLHESDPNVTWKLILKGLERFRVDDRGIQYVYDFLDDVVTAYNEFRDVLYELYEDNDNCCLDTQLFNKHVVLGFVVKNNPLTVDPYRHSFYGSPLFSKEDKKLEKIRFYFKRIDCLIKGFKIPSNISRIKVTPTKCTEMPLGQRAIPFYYEISPANPLNKFWNFDLFLRGKEDSILSYNADKYSSNKKALTPHKYNIRDYKYFRIEGCVGIDVDVAMDLLKKQDLPFRVIALQIDNKIDRVKPRFKHNYGELKFMHQLFRNDLRQNLVSLKDYCVALGKTFKDAKDLPLPKYSDPTIPYVEHVKNYTTKLERSITQMDGELSMDYNKFSHNKFEETFKVAVGHASNINKTIEGITRPSVFTPFEQLANNSSFRWLKWINTQIGKKEEKAKENTIFAKFYQKNTSIDHFAEVKRGDLYVLVYTSDDNKVVADYSGACCCDDIEDEVPEKQDDIVLDKEIKWPGKLRIFLGEKHELIKDLNVFRTEITGMDSVMTAIRKKFEEKAVFIDNLDKKVIEINSGIDTRFDKVRLDLKENVIDKFAKGIKDEVFRTVNLKIDKNKTDIKIETAKQISNIKATMGKEVKGQVDEVSRTMKENTGNINRLNINYGKIDSSTNSRMDLITAKVETKLTKVVNDEFVNIKKEVGAIKNKSDVLENKVKGVEGKITIDKEEIFREIGITNKALEFNTKRLTTDIESQKEAVNVYKNIVSGYVKTPKTGPRSTVAPETPIRTEIPIRTETPIRPGPSIRPGSSIRPIRSFNDSEYEHMATMLDYAKDHNERIIEKTKTGTKLTDTEISMQSKFDDITSDITNRLIKINEDKEDDIASGSEDEMILNIALQNMNSISDAGVKGKVKRNANRLANRLKRNPATSGKTVTINMLKKF